MDDLLARARRLWTQIVALRSGTLVVVDKDQERQQEMNDLQDRAIDVDFTVKSTTCSRESEQ